MALKFQWPLKLGTKERPAGASFIQSFIGAKLFDRNPAKFAEEGYIKNAIAFSCINKIATAVSSVSYEVCTRERDGKIKILPNHPLGALLRAPNPMSDGIDFMEALTAYRMIAGDAYILRNPQSGGATEAFGDKTPSELWLLPPDKMELKPGPTVMPLAYKYRPSGDAGAREYPVDQKSGYCDVLHLKNFNPLSQNLGLSPMNAAAFSIDIFNKAQTWNRALLDNSSKPPGVFQFKNAKGENVSLSPEQYTRLKEQIDTLWTGSQNAGTPFLLEGGLTWQQMGLTPQDMDFYNSVITAARFICTVYGVPTQVIGLPGDSTYSNYKEANEAFWLQTVIPLLNKQISALNRWLAPMYGDNVFIKYDLDTIPALEDRRQTMYDRAEKSTFLMVNEKRRMAGLDEVPYGDVILTNAGMLPLEFVVDNPDPAANDDGARKKYIEFLVAKGMSTGEAEKLATKAGFTHAGKE